jgi:hypothetical protein
MNEPNEKPDAKTAEEIYQEALKLSPEAREKLTCMLELAKGADQSADKGYATPAIERAWNEELARRVKLMEEGSMEFVDGNKFLNELRQKYVL